MARPPFVFFLVYTSTIHAELNVLHYKHATAQMFFFLVCTSTIHAEFNVLHYKHATAQMFLEGSLPIMHLVWILAILTISSLFSIVFLNSFCKCVVPIIAWSWVSFCIALREHFYPPIVQASDQNGFNFGSFRARRYTNTFQCSASSRCSHFWFTTGISHYLIAFPLIPGYYLLWAVK